MIRDYTCECGQKLRLPNKKISSFTCPECKRYFKVNKDNRLYEDTSSPGLDVTHYPKSPKSIIEFSLKWAAAGAIFGFAILANQISNGNVVTTEDRLAGATAGAIVGFIIGAIYKSYKKEK